VPGRRLYVTDAIVLSRFDYGEADRILTLLTPEHGKVRVIAKGCRRPTSRLGGSLEPLAALRVQLARGRTFDVVTQVSVERPWLRLRDALEPTATAWYLAELADRSLEERTATEPVYLLLHRAYELLDAGMTAGRVARWYEMRLANELGVRPEVDRCVECGRLVTADEPLRWLPAAGGVLCAAHPGPGQGSAGISADAVRVLKAYQRMDVEGLAALRLPAAVERDVERAMADFLGYALERVPRSRHFLDEVRAAYRAGVGEAAGAVPGAPGGGTPRAIALPRSGAEESR
jgi:DNA repair protein RecO (recombination protein O)